jgi:hypothetical protein
MAHIVAVSAAAAGLQPRLSIHTISEMKDTNLYKVRAAAAAGVCTHTRSCHQSLLQKNKRNRQFKMLSESVASDAT